MIQKLSKKGINDFAVVKTAENKDKDSVLHIIRKRQSPTLNRLYIDTTQCNIQHDTTLTLI